MKKRLFLVSLLLFVLVFAGCGKKENANTPTETEAFTGLRISTPADVKLAFYSGFSDDSKYKLPVPEATEDALVYNLPDIVPGLYSYTASGRGYYTVHKCLVVTPEKLAEGFYVNANPGKSAGSGYEQLKEYSEMPDEIMNGAQSSDPALFPGYEAVFTLPSFQNALRERGVKQVTTAEQMDEFLTETLKNTSHAYRFSLGESEKYQIDMPLVIFSNADLSGAKTYAEAADALKDSTLPCVMIAGAIHGNEPAGKDGILAWIKTLAGEKSAEYLEKMNLLFVPCQNPDGAKDYSRKSIAKDKDMNRDHLLGSCKEIVIMHDLFYSFLPDVFIDCHEYTARGTESETTMDYADALTATGATANTGEGLLKLGVDMLLETNEALSKNGLTNRYYPRSDFDYAAMNSQNPTSGRCYYSLTGAATFLIETQGINVSTSHYGRRVVTQYVAVESLLNYVKDNGDRVKEVVRTEREQLCEKGKTYSPDNVFVLSTDKGPDAFNAVIPVYNVLTGEKSGEKNYVAYSTTVLKETVPIATSYVIPADLPRIHEILAVFDHNHVVYEKLEKGTALKLAQINGNAAGSYTEEKVVTFSEGAYILRSNQLCSNILAFLMEPKAADAIGYKCSLVDMKLFDYENGLLPVYRSTEPNP